MIDLGIIAGSSFVVLGLARSGLAAVRALVAAGIGASPWTTMHRLNDAAAAAWRGSPIRCRSTGPQSPRW